MEAMASYATRYAVVYREMAFLVGGLYRMQGGKDRTYRRSFSPEAKALVRVWRAFLIKAEVDYFHGVPSGRSLYSFANRDRGWLLEFDGCLEGVGVRIIRYNRVTLEECVLQSAACAVDYGFRGNSAYQNAMELFALAFALLQAARLGARNQSVRLRGDSVTVLAWAQDNRFNSEMAMAASSLVLGICQHFDLVVDGTIHISSEDNWACDGLSRVGIPRREDATHKVYGQWEEEPWFQGWEGQQTFIQYGNPVNMPENELGIIDKIFDIHRLLDSLGAGE
jgi:hypothetical protein